MNIPHTCAQWYSLSFFTRSFSVSFMQHAWCIRVHTAQLAEYGN